MISWSLLTLANQESKEGPSLGLLEDKMKKLFENWNAYVLNEASLSRTLQHIEEHDCAIITAFRNDPADMSKCRPGSVQEKEGKTKQTNKRRNRDLKAMLLGLDFGVTKVDGSYVENFERPDAVEVKENSLFVVNLYDEPNFVDKVTRMAEKFCQDSVLIIPQGGKDAYLMGTNNSDFPGRGAKEVVGNLKMGKEAEFMTRVKGRPYTFTVTESLETFKGLTRLEKMAVRSICKRLIKDY
jgi:hypothetical protein